MVISSLSLRVMENDADHMTVSRPDAADAVPEIHAIRAPLNALGLRNGRYCPGYQAHARASRARRARLRSTPRR
jgi:hypothetical protein